MDIEGIKPASLAKVTDHGVRAFIEKCITHVSNRLPAKELLMDPFLQLDDENGSMHDDSNHNFDVGNNAKASMLDTSRDFRVKGRRKDNNTIFLKLRIEDPTGHIRNIHFPFDIEADTATSVASEMVEELNLTDQDASAIAAMIESEIQFHVAGLTPGESLEENFEIATPDTFGSENKDEAYTLTDDSVLSTGDLVVERLFSGRKFWSDSPRLIGGNSPAMPGHSCSSSPHGLVMTGDTSVKSSPSSVSNEENTNGAPSTEDLKEDYNNEIEENEARIPLSVGSKFDNRRGTTVDVLAGSREHLSKGKDESLGDLESEAVRVIVEELELMFLKQRNEFDELKRRHELAIYDVLKVLPPHVYREVVRRCNLKVSDP